MSDEVVLEMRDIVKEFPGVKALDGAHLKLYKGKVTTLMGENGAGKSTLMRIFFGIIPKTSGSIFLNGKEVYFSGPKDALENGVAMVHQELNQVMTLSIMENIWLGRYPKSGGFISRRKMYNNTKKIFQSLNLNLDPRGPIATLPVAQRQMIEIARAVSYDCKIMVLDEPTSSLTEVEVDHLFKIVADLKKRGVAILFVSHKMDEVFAISDYITVFRDGKYISDYPVAKASRNQIVKDMVGRELNNLFPPRVPLKKDAKVLFSVKNLSSPYAPVSDVSFDVREGEILGIAGLVGSQRTETLDLLFGRRTKSADSELFLEGKKITNSNPRQSVKNKFAYVTEERKQDGIFDILDINFNMIVANISKYRGFFGFLRIGVMKRDVKAMIDALSVKTPSQRTQIGSLSGGNQQKVIVARWLISQPDVFLLDEPTRGIDVGAKYQIYELINKLAGYGKCILFVSSEMGELMGVAHRIMVMSNGKLAGIVDGKSATQEQLMLLAQKYY